MLETFDIISYLKDRRITYFMEGKNVTAGWVEVRCPWCNDRSHHLGINLDSRFMACWRCGPKGPITNLIMEIDECSYFEARNTLGQFQDKIYKVLKRDIQARLDHNVLPSEATDEPLPMHADYLHGRGFDPVETTKKYKLKFVGPFGFWKFRIIIPIIFQGKVVNFTARDISGKASVPYINLKNEQAIIPMKECVYNIDSVRDTVLVVEGATDVWRMGDGAVAVMGMEFTKEQIALIVETGVKRAVVMFDGEPQAIKKATKLSIELADLIPSSEVIELPGGDPGSLTMEDVKQIRKEVFGYD